MIMTRNGKPGAERNRWRPDSILVWTAAEESTLMQCLEAKLTDHKRTSIKALMKYNQVALNSMPTSQFDQPVHAGDTLSVNFTRPFVVFSHPRIKLVYEDNDIIVINKGSGILSVSTDNVKDGTAYSILRDYLKKKDPRLMLFVVHRLDRDTSGLMMFAKTEESQQVLRHNWNNMILERLYVAVLEGYLEEDKGYVKSRLAENSQFVVYSTDVPGEGRLAVTHYEVMERGHGYTLAQFSLDTGRKNQIRVHASDLGHPIAGDRKYGASTSPIHRLALHAMTLRFAHPVTRKDMNFQTPIPAAFIGAVRKGSRR